MSFDKAAQTFPLAGVPRVSGRLYLATWAHPHNKAGRLYLATMLPFHVLIARNGLACIEADS